MSSVETVHPGRVQVALGPGQSPGVRSGHRTKRTKRLNHLNDLNSFCFLFPDQVETKRNQNEGHKISIA